MERDLLTLRHDSHEPQLKELSVTDLTFIHDLTVDGQMRVCERMLADRTPEETARAARRARTLSPLAATPDLPPVAHPLGRVAASTLSTAARTRQVTPSPADPAACGTYSEDRA